VVSIDSLRRAFNASPSAIAVVRVKRDGLPASKHAADAPDDISLGGSAMNVHLSMNRRSTGTSAVPPPGMAFPGSPALERRGSASASATSKGQWEDALDESIAEDEEVKRSASTCSLDPVYLNKALLRMLDIRTMQVRAAAGGGWRRCGCRLALGRDAGCGLCHAAPCCVCLRTQAAASPRPQLPAAASKGPIASQPHPWHGRTTPPTPCRTTTG
jgi:hypothetical protein